ncbi:MAG TPA: nucleotidyltransferase family protein [Candidatus Dorea gallistercoris]|uniref:Nucleotidyltransferase family protein n=1 Tax=Candidatus Dorea gallistercoris TaxID=2838542 RepID=A0A9D1RE08_9FIRM|nr:nucleotidyltransferase family protein [Candidatus Dorea gallistercoris]
MSGRSGTSRQEAYLIELVASTVNQQDPILGTEHPAWGWLYKMSDYHHVSNLVYYKIMWEDGRDARIWKEKFELRYREALRQQERYEALRVRLEEELEQDQIHSIFLGEMLVLGYYPRPEMRMPETLQIQVERKHVFKARKILERIGFEAEKDKEGRETGVYTQIPDLKVEIREKLPFTAKETRVWFQDFPRILPRKTGRHYIHYLNGETLYIYLLCRLAEKYARGLAEIRDMVDLWLFLSKEGPGLKWKEIQEEVESLKLDLFSEYVIKLTGSWFGRMYFQEDMEFLEDMRTYIFSKGAEARKANEMILPLVKVVADNYYRDLEKEEKEKQRKWTFPSLDYMAASFPKLKKWPFLLPFYWWVRILRQRRFRRKQQEKQEKEGNQT